MASFVIEGGHRLNGSVRISGSKNATVALIPAAVLAHGPVTICGVPDISDVRSLSVLLNELGVEVTKKQNDIIIIDPTKMENRPLVGESVSKLRASYYFMGALLGKYGRVEMKMPGGCYLGPRPIDLHLKGFEALGATVQYVRGSYIIEAEELVGNKIFLDISSVGATINIMLAASMAEGITTIENAAKEPHVVDLANYLNMMGANIKGAGTDVIRIRGVEKLHGAQYTIIPDQIEAGTYMIAAAITGGDVLVKNIIPKHMDSLTAKLDEMNVTIEEHDDSIRVTANRPLHCANVKTMSYPGFPTDLQPQIAALLSVCEGTSVITENVWDNRYQYIDELCKLGAQVVIDGRKAHIEGVPYFHGAKVSATDLRAGAAMILAALAAEGTTEIDGVKYIDRGYEDVENKFNALGADITRITI